MDPNGSGFISVSDFQRILKDELINVSEEVDHVFRLLLYILGLNKKLILWLVQELLALVSRYDKSGRGSVRYLDFLDEIAVPAGF